MKIEEQVLSIEQMKHLQELGVDTSDASMCWKVFPTENGYYDYQVYHETNIQDDAELVLNKITDDDDAEYIPTYTIGDLIGKLPKIIGNHRLLIDLDAEIAYYQDWFSDEVLNCIGEHGHTDRPITNVLYYCLCWVAEKHKELLEVKK